MQANPLLQVQIKLTAKQAMENLLIIRLMARARCLEHTDESYTLVLNPPKGTVSNQLWAEQVYKYCLEHNIPALIVRPERNAQEVAS